MKGLRKYLSPFAPDQSGAAAVLCEFHGLIIILDAGGCAGNICGFDEPRWFESRSAIFSAGLRDMDAILGRDDRLVEKIGKACEKLSADFIAVIGTPVPAVIGTDYRALSRMIEKKTGIPALTIDTDGTKLYDDGEKKTWKELFKKFAVEKEVEPGRVGIIGATPLEFGGIYEEDFLKIYFEEKGFSKVVCYGMGDGLEAVREAAAAEKNIVVSPAGIAAAKYLQQKFGTPYELFCPPEIIPEWKERKEQAEQKAHKEQIEQKMQKEQTAEMLNVEELSKKKILIVHQQVLANTLREELISNCMKENMNEKAKLKVQQSSVSNSEEKVGITDIKLPDVEALGDKISDERRIGQKINVDVASWFMMDKKQKEENDILFKEEDDWIAYIKENEYDIIIADPLLKKAVPFYKGEWYDLPHFAISGKKRPTV